MLILLALALLSCSGQTEQGSSEESIQVAQPEEIGASKLTKTQHSTESDNVNSILEDQNGNFWFGTTGEGVYMFDRKVFKQYTTSDGLKSNMTFCVFESSQGEIWLGTEDGLYRFEDSAFTEVLIVPPVHSNRNTFCVFSIMEDRGGKLWFATVEGVFLYDGNTFEPFIVSEEGPGYLSSRHNTEYILEDADGNMWFGSRVNDGIFRYDGKSMVQMKLESLNGHTWAWPVLQDRQGNIWLSNWGGTYRYDGESFTSFTKEAGLCSRTIMRVIEDKEGNIWFGGGDGLCRYDGESFEHFTTVDGLPRDGVWSILEDREQHLWIGTRNTGLCMYDGTHMINLSESQATSP